MSDIHSCSYYCTRPACVLAQRDELRDKLEQAEPVVEPPKSFRVGYLTGYIDGQRELREKQQAAPASGGFDSMDDDIPF